MKSKAYAFLPVALLTGLICACASTNKTANGEIDRTEPLPEPSGKAVTAEDIQRTPDHSLDKVLSGRFPGVWVTRAPDGGIRVRIRGAMTLQGNQEPLYVLDGIPLEPGPGNALTGIVPGDIASIEVLKDAIGTTMYGVRGANGVILIKTKRPDQ